MKNVDVIMSGTLKKIVGPVQTIKRIKDSHDFFVEKGYKISVFCSDDLPTPLLEPIRKSQSTIIRRMKELKRWLMLHTRLYAAYCIYCEFSNCRRLLDYYQEQNRHPDIMVFHSIYDCYMYLKFYRKKENKEKIVLFTHGDGFLFEMLLGYYPKLKGSLVERKLDQIANYVTENVDMIPCIAKIEQKNLLTLYPQLKGKTCLVINGITDLTDKQKEISSQIRGKVNTPKYRFVCSGNINGRKGQYIIVDAICKMDDSSLANMHVTFVGDGKERITLEDKVKRYNKQQFVNFTGALPNTEVYQELAKANIFILMSALEGLPIALIEALRSGLALVSTRVSGIPELIKEEVNGILLNPNVDELLDLLTHLDKYDWNEMGIESRKYYEEYYQFSRMRNDYLNMLETVSQKK